jgi:hypothetical protein
MSKSTKTARATRKSSKGVTLSAGAAAFDAAMNAPETVKIETEGFPLPATDLAPATGETVRELSDGTPADEAKLEEQAPEQEQVDEAPAEPARRRHMTNIVKGMRVNGIGVPAINGKCHEAWKMFDALTYYEGEGDDAKLHTPALGDGLIKGAELGLNPGNIKVEYPRWRKFNGFAAVTRRATATAPVAPVEPAPADADAEKEGADAE